MRIYLAGRHNRRDELRRCADDLRKMGHEVTARWLEEHHQAPGPLDHPAWATIAQEDVEDVSAADTVIGFAEPERGGGGGRHVEFGMGLAQGKRMLVVGNAEHLFHTLPAVQIFNAWSDALHALTSG